MANLVQLNFENGDFASCTDLDDAKKKANTHSHVDGKILVEIIPEGGGPMTTLEFDRSSRDWIAV